MIMRFVRRTLPLLLTLLVFAAALVWGLAVHPDNARATAPTKCPAIVIVGRDEPVACDADGSQLLIVTGTTGQECADMGGIYWPMVPACVGVDY